MGSPGGVAAPRSGKAVPMALAHITLATRDVRRSSAFFVEALGWRPIARPGNIDRPAAWLAIAPGIELHLVEDPEFEPSPFEKEFGRHIAVAFPLAEFPALKNRLVARVRHAHRPDPRHPVPAVLLPRPGRLRLRGRGRRPRRTADGLLREPHFTWRGPPRNRSGLVRFGRGGRLGRGSIRLDQRRREGLVQPFSTCEAPFITPP